MSALWWGLDDVGTRAETGRSDRSGAFPALLDPSSQAVRADLRTRIAGFTPDWTATPGDPGVVLVKAFAEQLAPIKQRVNLLPETQLRSLLDIGGVGPRPASPARATIVFTIADNASEAVTAPEGLKLSVPPVGDGDAVVFETSRPISITAARLSDVLVQFGSGYTRRDPTTIGPGSPLASFGSPPRPGGAVWFGFTAEGLIGPTLDVGVRVLADDATGSATHGGWDERDPASAVLAWDAILATGPRPLAVPVDTTRSLTQNGVIQFGIPPDWTPTASPGSVGGPPRRWLRVRLIQPGGGQPSLVGLDLNSVEAEATETFRDEALEPVGQEAEGAQTFRFRRTPVVPESAQIEVDAPVDTDVFGVESPSTTTRTSWTLVESLSNATPTAQVFTIEPTSGEVRFGDGIRGAAVPEGFRNVRALAYRAGGGPQGNVPAGSTLTPLDTIPFLTSATIPVAASGGGSSEELPALLRSGPQTLRCRGRAVTAADYDALALAVPAAALSQARAFQGVDIDGTPRPGQVSIVVVGARPDPAQPGDGTLDAVARYLVEHVTPAGVRLVVRAPTLVAIRVEASVTVDSGADQGRVLRDAGAALDRLLDARGTPTEPGWPLGKTIAYRAVVSCLAAVEGIAGVLRLTLVRDGRRLGRCADALLPPDGLPETRPHLLLPVDPEVAR